MNEKILEVLKKVPACCLYCKNTFKRNRFFSADELLKIERGEIDPTELDMRADLPSEKSEVLHCDLYLQFVNKSHKCKSFEYRCSIIQEGYALQEAEKEKAKKNNIGEQLKFF